MPLDGSTLSNCWWLRPSLLAHIPVQLWRHAADLHIHWAGCAEMTHILAMQLGLQDLCRPTQGDFLHMPFEDSSFDGAYAIEATCHAAKVGCMLMSVTHLQEAVWNTTSIGRGSLECSVADTCTSIRIRKWHLLDMLMPVSLHMVLHTPVLLLHVWVPAYCC